MMGEEPTQLDATAFGFLARLKYNPYLPVFSEAIDGNLYFSQFYQFGVVLNKYYAYSDTIIYYYIAL